MVIYTQTHMLHASYTGHCYMGISDSDVPHTEVWTWCGLTDTHVYNGKQPHNHGEKREHPKERNGSFPLTSIYALASHYHRVIRMMFTIFGKCRTNQNWAVCGYP